MKIKVTIDITFPEGRQVVEEFKNSPVVNDYIGGEIFWKLVKSKRKKNCTDNGIT